MIGRLLARLRRDLVAGLVVVAPVGVTAYVLVWLFRRLDSILGGYLPGIIGARVPGLGIVVLVALLLLVGWGLRWAIGRQALGSWNRLLSRVPVARRIYRASSQIFETVLNREEKIFQSCALIEYPSPGSYSLVFVTARAPAEMERAAGSELVSVFLPTAPNPTTGYVLQLPAGRVRLLSMSIEDGIKLVVSAGVAVPEAAAGTGPGADAHRGLDGLLGESGKGDG